MGGKHLRGRCEWNGARESYYLSFFGHFQNMEQEGVLKELLLYRLRVSH